MVNSRTELWLVRHGQTDWNVEGRYQGQADMPLNEIGLKQARELAIKISEIDFEAVYSSDLQRALTTAQILARDKQVNIDRRLREIHQGEWEGQLFSVIRQRYADFFQSREQNPLESRPPGGESLQEVAERVKACVDEIAKRHQGKRILVVSHGLAIATLIAAAKGLPLSHSFELIPDNAEPQIIFWPPALNGNEKR
ncbi:MAG: histidine phosphatase family protein [Bellilinea sp.]|nr:histidine phosphatase family protein [Bellilinea sp.]